MPASDVESDAESEDERVRPVRRRRRSTPFGVDASDAGSDGDMDTGSVCFENIVDSGEDGLSEGEGDVRSEAGSVMSRSQPYDQYDREEVALEIEDGEEAALAARKAAGVGDEPESPSDTDSNGDGGRRRKRKYENDSEADDSVDRMVPFMVHGFCQGCKCKQNVYILGEIKKRRLLEADQVLVAMQARYGVALVRGDRRTVDKPSSPFDSGRMSTDRRGTGVNVTGFSR